MAQPVMQHSFNSGEWAPALNARVDLAKYHSGAALLRNFFVDYRGGATARAGTRYILKGFRDATAIRLIPFQASFTVSYMLEFGNQYIRFYNNGAPVLEAATTISGVTNANPGVIHDIAHGYGSGDWVFITNIVGTTQLNNNYYIVVKIDADHYTLTDLFGAVVDTTAFGVYVSGGQAQRVYTITTSPYTSSELSQIKFIQDVNILILTHPNHPPQVLTLISATNWTIGAITFGATIAAPGSPSVATTLSSGSVNYAYVITAVDSNGQESAPSAFAVLANVQDIRSTAGSNTVSWSAVVGAASYNVYKAEPSYAGAVPAGSAFGFIGNVTGIHLVDSNIGQDFSQGPPVPLNPFSGSGVQTITRTLVGTYGTGTGSSNPIPLVTLTGGGGSGALAYAVMGCTIASISSVGRGYNIGDSITIFQGGGCILQVTSITPPFGAIATVAIITAGALVYPNLTPANPAQQTSTSGGGSGATFSLTWGVQSVPVSSPGTGYATPPTVNFSFGAAAATAVLGASSSGNPSVPALHQQRLVLAGPVLNPQQFNMSSTGEIYNFNVHSPLEADDAIQGSLVSGQLNTIQSMISQPQGLIILSDKQAWLLNGGSPGSAITPAALVANSQAYNGASYPPPIVANNDILYIQSKTSIVRNLVFNFYTQVYTGADISVLSSHLFYGFQVLEWAWAEEPFKLVWAVRNDGTMLTLTFLKEQELIAWAHSDTQGLFKSVATITEQVSVGSVDAIYTVVQRTVAGQTVQYIERMAELYYPNGVSGAWCVDAGLQYNGVAALTFSGGQHLQGFSVTGLATDDQNNTTVIPAFTMPASGTFTLAAPPSPATGYTRVTVGLPYTPQLTTLQLDTGEPTIQGKEKKISSVTLRVAQTLGLQIGTGTDFGTNMVDIQDLVPGNVGTATNELVTDLVTGDAWSTVDPAWTVPGQYSVQQVLPYPASILGVIPQLAVGDTPK